MKKSLLTLAILLCASIAYGQQTNYYSLKKLLNADGVLLNPSTAGSYQHRYITFTGSAMYFSDANGISSSGGGWKYRGVQNGCYWFCMETVLWQSGARSVARWDENNYWLVSTDYTVLNWVLKKQNKTYVYNIDTPSSNQSEGRIPGLVR